MAIESWVPLLVAVLGPTETVLLTQISRHEKRKRILELAEKRLSIWKTEAELKHTYCPEECLGEKLSEAIRRIEQDANNGLAELVWLEKLERQYSVVRVNLLLYQPDHPAKSFSRYRVLFWVFSVIYVVFAGWVVWTLHTHPLPSKPEDRPTYYFGVGVYYTIAALFYALAMGFRAAARRTCRPKPPLYESI